jgi:hypothetical protein
MRHAAFFLLPALLSSQAPAPVFEATSTVIRPGQSVALRWDAPKAEKVRLDPGGLLFEAKGTVTVKPAGTTTYVLTALNGATLGSIEIKVDQAAVLGEPARICTFESSSKLVMAGEPVVLKWECVGDAKVRLEPGGLELDGRSEITVTPLESTRYVLSVSNLAGGMNKALEVKVLKPSPLGAAARIRSFTSDLSVVAAGDPVELRWDCPEEASVRLEPGGLELTGRDRILVQPRATTVYTLNVSNLAGGMSRSLEIRVEKAPNPDLAAASTVKVLDAGDLGEAIRRGQAQRQERLEQLPKAWTLRMVVSGHAPGLKKVALAAGKEAGDIMVLPYVRRDGFRWWQACYGAFPTRSAALKAWSQLPPALQKAFGEPLPLKLERLPGDPPKSPS